MSEAAGREASPYEQIDDGDTTWRFERAFFASTWRCLWGRGCKGIESFPAEHLGLGCCSVGAVLDGEDEAMNIAALAQLLAPHRFQHHDEAARDGVFSDATATATRVVDGACVFLNRPGFAGGAGCALHLAALDQDESPIDWKPSVCWQLPIHVDFQPRADGGEVATVRRWSRADWGDEGDTMVWCCTEEPECYTGDRPVVDSLAAEIEAITGREVYVELRRRTMGG